MTRHPPPTRALPDPPGVLPSVPPAFRPCAAALSRPVAFLTGTESVAAPCCFRAGGRRGNPGSSVPPLPCSACSPEASRGLRLRALGSPRAPVCLPDRTAAANRACRPLDLYLPKQHLTSLHHPSRPIDRPRHWLSSPTLNGYGVQISGGLSQRRSAKPEGATRQSRLSAKMGLAWREGNDLSCPRRAPAPAC